MVVTQKGGMAAFGCEVLPERERVRIVPIGDIDLATAPILGQELRSLFAAGWSRVVVDLHETTFMDSSGLHVLMDCEEAARRSGCQFSVVFVPAQVQRLFEIAGVAKRFSSFDSAPGGRDGASGEQT